MDIKFINACKKEGLTPMFTKIAISHPLITLGMKSKLNHEMLRKASSDLYYKRTNLELELYSLHLQLGKQLTTAEFDKVDQVSFDQAHRNATFKGEIHLKKLQQLRIQQKRQQVFHHTKNTSYRPSNNVNSVVSSHVFEVINLSKDRTLSNEECEVLSKGLKYSFPVKPNAYQLCADLHSAASKVDISLRNDFLNQAKHSITKFLTKASYRPHSINNNQITLSKLKTKLKKLNSQN